LQYAASLVHIFEDATKFWCDFGGAGRFFSNQLSQIWDGTSTEEGSESPPPVISRGAAPWLLGVFINSAAEMRYTSGWLRL